MLPSVAIAGLLTLSPSTDDPNQESLEKWFPEFASLEEQPAVTEPCGPAIDEPRVLHPEAVGGNWGDPVADSDDYLSGWAVIGVNIDADGSYRGRKKIRTGGDIRVTHVRKCLRDLDFAPARVDGVAQQVQNYPMIVRFRGDEVPVITFGIEPLAQTSTQLIGTD